MRNVEPHQAIPQQTWHGRGECRGLSYPIRTIGEAHFGNRWLNL